MAYTSAQLVAAYTAANNGVAPDAATTALLNAFAAQTQTGQLSDAAALSYVLNSADNDVNVALQSYQFFTGKAPTKAGLDYLTNSATNPNDLNDPFYAQFNLENRYINFAANLGVAGEGATAFRSTYGGLTFADYVDVVYETIIGSSYAQTAGINVVAAKADIIARQANFVQIATERGLINASSTAEQRDIAVKAAVAGYLMAEGIKADVGIYAAGANNFVNALVNGNAVYNSNLITTYAPLGGGTGQAVGGTGSTPGGNKSLALTSSTDVITGTAGDDVITGARDTTAGSLQNTLTLGDTINGGAGTDTLNVTNLGGGSVLAGITLNSVETVNVNNASAAGTVAELNAALAPGLTTAGVTGQGDVTVTNIGGATLNVAGYTATQAQSIVANGASKINVSSVGSGTGGSITVDVSGGTPASAVTLSNTGTGAAALTTLSLGATTKALTVQANGRITATTVNAAGLETVVVGGAAAPASAATGSVSLGTLGSTVLKSVDASGLTAGGLAVGIGANVATTFKGGQGNDIVTIATGAAMTGTVDAGAGTGDVLAISGTAATGAGAVANTSLTAATKGLFSGFEVLRVSAAVTGGPAAATDFITFNADNVPAGVTSFQVGASGNGVRIDNLGASATVTQVGNVTGAGGVVLSLKDASGLTDVVNYAMSNLSTTGAASGVTTTSLSAPGVETLNITSAGATLPGFGLGVNTITSLAADASLTTVKINGSAPLALTTAALTKTATIDGSAATGQLSINAGATGAANIGVNINGGSANDTIFAANGTGAVNQSINGGAGGDLITLSTQATTRDVLVYKSGTDSLYDVTGTSGASAGAYVLNTGKMDAVSNFVSGTDKIDVTSFALTAQQLGIASKGAVASTDALAALANATGFFVDAATVQRGVAQVQVGGDTYLFVDANKNGTFDVATDLAVKLVGVGAIANGDLIGS